MDCSDSPDFVFTYFEWQAFLESEEAGEAFGVASSIPNSSKKGKYAICLQDRIALFDANDYDLALRMLRGDVTLE